MINNIKNKDIESISYHLYYLTQGTNHWKMEVEKQIKQLGSNVVLCGDPDHNFQTCFWFQANTLIRDRIDLLLERIMNEILKEELSLYENLKVECFANSCRLYEDFRKRVVEELIGTMFKPKFEKFCK